MPDIFENKINLGEGGSPEDAMVKERLGEVIAKLKRIDPARYGAVDPGKLTPDNELYNEIRRQVLRTVKPEQLEKKIEGALGELGTSPKYEDLYKERLGKVRAATGEGTPAGDLRARELSIRKQLSSAPAEAREKYKDVFDPFAREKLASQYTGQIEGEADAIRSMREPELALYEKLPSLAQDDIEEQRKTLAEKLQNLRSLYSTATSEAGTLDDELEKVLSFERQQSAKKTGGGGSGYRSMPFPPVAETGDDDIDSIVDDVVDEVVRGENTLQTTPQSTPATRKSLGDWRKMTQ